MALNWFQRFWGMGASQPSAPYFGPSMTNWAGSQVSDPTGLAAVRRCVSILSDGVASTNVSLLQSLPGGGKISVVDHPSARALRLLSYPDIELMLSDALYSGNGFALVDRSDRATVRVQVISAHRVTVAVDQQGKPWYEIAENSLLNQPKMTVPQRDMVHLKYRVDPSNPLVGLSPLRAAKGSHAALTDVYLLHGRLASNQSNPGMILSTEKDMTKEQVTRLRELWDQQSGGFKTGGTVILSNGLTTADSKQHISQKDADLIEALRFSVEEASRIFGVPPSMLGYSQHTSFATSAEERRAFLSSTLRPLMLRVADAFNQALLTEAERMAGLSVEFDSSDFGAGKELAETISSLVNSGILTLNEARNKLSLVDVEGGDIPRVPSNTMPQDSWAKYFNQNKAPTE
jgi:HK97 family phage portal protein